MGGSGTTKSGRVDQETWDRLLAAYRDDPGNHSAAARLAVVQRRTARRAYEVGYPERPWGRVSIRDLIMGEAELARSRVQLELEKEELATDRHALDAERDREAARQHSVRAKTEEAVLVSGARAAAMRGLAACIGASDGVKAAMARLGQELVTISSAGGALSHKEMVSLSNIGRRYASTLRELATAGLTAMEMERLYLGEPSKIIGVKSEYDDMPTEDLLRMAGYQDGVLRRAQDRGLVVLDGGLGKAVTS